MSEMAPEKPALCLVCSQPLPPRAGRGRPRKVCRDEDSPTPGGCARWRNIERTLAAAYHPRRGRNPWPIFPTGGFTIERLRPPERPEPDETEDGYFQTH